MSETPLSSASPGSNAIAALAEQQTVVDRLHAAVANLPPPRQSLLVEPVLEQLPLVPQGPVDNLDNLDAPAQHALPLLPITSTGSLDPLQVLSSRVGPPSVLDTDHLTQKQDLVLEDGLGSKNSPHLIKDKAKDSSRDPTEQHAHFNVELVETPAPAGSRSRMWSFLFLFALFAGCQSIFLRLSSIVAPSTVVSNGSYLLVFMLGDGTALLAFALRTFAFKIHWQSVLPRRAGAGAAAGMLNAIGIVGFTMLNADGGEASLLAPLTSLNLVVPVIFGFLAFGDRATLRKLAGIVLGVGATMMFAFGGGSSFSFSDMSTLTYFFIVFFGWGFTTTLFQLISLLPANDLAAAYVSSVVAFTVTGIVAAVSIFGQVDLTNFDWAHIMLLLAGACHGIANACFVYLSQAMPSEASVVAPLSSLNIVLPVAVGMIALGEEVTALKIVGSILAVVAVLMMGVSDLTELVASLNCCCRTSKDTTQHMIPAVVDDEGHVVVELQWRDLDWDDTMHFSVNKPEHELEAAVAAALDADDVEEETAHLSALPLMAGAPVLPSPTDMV